MRKPGLRRVKQLTQTYLLGGLGLGLTSRLLLRIPTDPRVLWGSERGLGGSRSWRPPYRNGGNVNGSGGVGTHALQKARGPREGSRR